MKQKDLALLIVVAFVSVVLSIFVSKLLFKIPTDRSEQVDNVPVISSNFEIPSSQYFNSQSLDPTQLITIGDNNNTNPFDSATQ